MSSTTSMQDVFHITAFSSEEIAKGRVDGWKTHRGICREIKNRILPSVVEKDGRKALYINANDNGAIIFKPVKLDPEKYPFLNWDWKVSNIMPDSMENEVGRDDYPAAVCIVYGKTFLGIPYKYKILIYVYGNNIPAGTRFTNPCEKRARVIIVQSGANDTGKWFSYKMNHLQDYLQEFGQPPPEIVYVGFQTNADRTHSKVEAWYSDVFLSGE